MHRRMSRRMALVAAFVSLSAGAAPLTAQGVDPLIGRWTVEYEVGRRIENGDVEPIRGVGQITIAPSGDSLRER